jgi:hypothetical protein
LSALNRDFMSGQHRESQPNLSFTDLHSFRGVLITCKDLPLERLIITSMNAQTRQDVDARCGCSRLQVQQAIRARR